jgi:drug/metabolite transporter (DMT)-like permease
MSATPVARPFRVFALMLGSGVLMSLMVVFARLAAADTPIVQITFFRNFVGAICMFILIAGDPRGMRPLLTTRRPLGHALRGLSGVIGISLNFWAAKLLPLADASALFFSMPLIVTLLAPWALKEHVDWRRWVTVIIGFVGILIIARPTGEGSLFGSLVAMAGAFFTAMSVIMVRRLGSSEPEMRTVFYFFTFGAVASSFFLPAHWVAPTLPIFIYLVSTGMAGTLGQLLLTRAYAEAPAAFISTFNYLSILYSTFFGWLLWREWPEMSMFIGAGIVIASGLVNIALEKSRKVKIAEAEVEASYG